MSRRYELSAFRFSASMAASYTSTTPEVGALISPGTVRCWGDNRYGRLGNGTRIDFPVAMPVVGLGRKATAIAAGEFHTCALLDDGTVRCWGYSLYGQLGDGTTTISRTTPVTVSGLSNVTAIAAGWGHTCAVLNDGTARCWGDNFFGQLGDGTTTISRTTPVTVSGLSNVTAIAAGLYHTCALLTDKTVRCWGSNRYGQLGDGTRGVSRTTLEAVSGLSNVTAIAAGGSHTCAQLGNETARCWGFNEYGQLGNGELGFATTPSLAYTAASTFFPILRRP